MNLECTFLSTERLNGCSKPQLLASIQANSSNYFFCGGIYLTLLQEMLTKQNTI